MKFIERSIIPSLFASVINRVPPISSLFPYTTLFRSQALERPARRRGKGGMRQYGSAALATALALALGACGSDRKSTRLNSSHVEISYAVFCLKKKNRVRCSSHDFGIPCSVVRRDARP